MGNNGESPVEPMKITSFRSRRKAPTIFGQSDDFINLLFGSDPIRIERFEFFLFLSKQIGEFPILLIVFWDVSSPLYSAIALMKKYGFFNLILVKSIYFFELGS